MNRPIRRVGIFVGVLLLAVVLNLNWVQVIKADHYQDNSANRRTVLDEYKRQRGSIVLQGSGTPVAESVPTKDALMYLRKYSNGPVYAPVTGFNSLYYGNTAIEAAENGVLAGTDDRLFVQRLTNLLTGRDTRGGNVLLTINKQAQAAAYQAMGDPARRGGGAGPGDRGDPGRGQHPVLRPEPAELALGGEDPGRVQEVQRRSRTTRCSTGRSP